MAVVILAGIAVVGGASFLGKQVGEAFNDGGTNGVDVEGGLEIEVVIPAGASAQDIAAILAARGVVGSAGQFETAVRTAGAAGDLRAGTYLLTTGMDPADVLDALRSGPISDAVRVTIREGLRVTEIIDDLAAATELTHDEFVSALEEGTVTTNLREMPESPTLADWEGLLFPDTYEFTPTASARAILQRLTSTMEQRVADVDWSRLEEAGFDRYEGIVIASLVESEVRVAEERPLVASVVFNRLDEDMLLQIDASVLYALDTRSPGDFDADVDSPYNTYRISGLPPTPISGPGMASLEAAADPADTEFLYYVLSSPDGSHTFTTNLDDHNDAVRRAREDGVLP